jgi:hypothetical protein
MRLPPLGARRWIYEDGVIRYRVLGGEQRRVDACSPSRDACAAGPETCQDMSSTGHAAAKPRIGGVITDNVRWAGRLALETPDLQLAELAGALESLHALPDEHAQRSLLALGRARSPARGDANTAAARASYERAAGLAVVAVIAHEFCGTCTLRSRAATRRCGAASAECELGHVTLATPRPGLTGTRCLQRTPEISTRPESSTSSRPLAPTRRRRLLRRTRTSPRPRSRGWRIDAIDRTSSVTGKARTTSTLSRRSSDRASAIAGAIVARRKAGRRGGTARTSTVLRGRGCLRRAACPRPARRCRCRQRDMTPTPR